MTNNVLITAATVREMECFEKLQVKMTKTGIDKLVTGIGPVATVYAIMNYLAGKNKPDLLINIGIAGSFRKNLTSGSVVVPLTDCFADLGVCDGRQYIPLDRAGIDIKDDYTPSGNYYADRDRVKRIGQGITPVKAVTVCTATGSLETREALKSEYNPDIETMEGASAYYVSNREGISCIGIRAVSNMVGPRDISSWDVDLALDRLSDALSIYLNDILHENS